MSKLLVKAFQSCSIDYGPGYRVYYTQHGRSVVILLAGGDKSTQARDIKTALRLATNL
jgi:putative addiction module killer protein